MRNSASFLLSQREIVQRLVNLDAVFVFNQPESAKRFIKKLTRDRDVRVIPAKVCSEILGRDWSGSRGLPTSAIIRKILAKRFTRELKGRRSRPFSEMQLCEAARVLPQAERLFPIISYCEGSFRGSDLSE